MKKFLNMFRKDEDGAVTVDFVVLTAAIVILAGVVATTLSTSATTVATGVATTLGATNTN